MKQIPLKPRTRALILTGVTLTTVMALSSGCLQNLQNAQQANAQQPNTQGAPRSAAKDSTKSVVLTGEAARGDWTTDAPGVRRRLTIADLDSPIKPNRLIMARGLCRAP